MYKKKKLLWLGIATALCLTILGIGCVKRIKSPSFKEYTNEIFKKEIATDTLSLHYTVANPSLYDIDANDIVLQGYQPDAEKEQYIRMENYLNALQKMDETSLGKEDKYTYNLLCDYFTHELMGSQFYYFREVLSPSNGTQTQFPILMAEYTFRSKKDIEDYLSLLSKTPAYFHSLVEFEKEKSKRGYFMADYSLEKVQTQCETLLSKDAIECGNCFLQLTFNERLENAVAEKLITSQEANHYSEVHTEVLSNEVYPAYTELADSLETFANTGKNENGLAHYLNGNAYYSWLFRRTTGSHMAVDKVYEVLAVDYYTHLKSLKEKIIEFQENSNLSAEEMEYFPLSGADDMLEHLKASMNEDFPSVASVSTDVVPAATVKAVSPAMENYTAPAYYLTPPIDDMSHNIIYINEKEVPAGIQLYTTLAHEGYPGHLYQTTYFGLYGQKSDISPVRSLLNYGGYVEGWALYTELQSYDYAAALLEKETANADYRLLYDIYREERCLQLSLLSLLDIGIHYYGFSEERVAEILSAYGFSNDEQIRNVYEYIVEEPAVYPKYYWGYLEIEKIKTAARKLWGKSYSDLRFHQFILQAGPSDFNNLEKRLYSFSSSILSK